MYFPLVILSLFFAVTTFLRGYIKNIRGIKYIYTENWYKVVKIYIFAVRNLSDVGCNGVTLLAKKTDKSNKFTYEIPIKICVSENDNRLREIKGANIEFVNGNGGNVRIFENNKNLGKVIRIKADWFFSGYEGKYFINISGAYNGIEIPIKVEAKILKIGGKESRIIKPQILINGQETNLLKIKI